MTTQDARSTGSRAERSPSRHSTWVRALVCAAIVAALAVHLPVLRAPLLLDDYAQRAMVGGEVTPRRAPFDLYDYIDDIDRALLLDRGAIPWWTNSRLVV